MNSFRASIPFLNNPETHSMAVGNDIMTGVVYTFPTFRDHPSAMVEFKAVAIFRAVEQK